MGAHLVARVLADWTHLGDRAFRVLVRMALTALDKPTADTPAATYFAGRELLAMTLRGGGSEQSRNRTVALVIAELIEAGAIERTDAGRQGHNAVFRLILKASESAKKDPNQGGFKSHPQGGFRDHPQGGSWSQERVASEATPRNHEEPLEELLEERRGALTTASHPPRAIRSDAKPAPVIALFPGTANAPDEMPYRPPPRRTTRAQDAIAEAQARVAARKAAHQAQLAAETEVS